jgi:hypothetical protein
MLLEALPLVGVEDVEGVESGKLVAIVGHVDPNPIRPAARDGSERLSHDDVHYFIV